MISIYIPNSIRSLFGNCFVVLVTVQLSNNLDIFSLNANLVTSCNTGKSTKPYIYYKKAHKNKGRFIGRHVQGQKAAYRLKREEGGVVYERPVTHNLVFCAHDSSF